MSKRVNTGNGHQLTMVEESHSFGEAATKDDDILFRNRRQYTIMMREMRD